MSTAKKYPAFQFYVADFLVGVAELTTEAVGAYILLLCRQWDKGSIPDDQQKCAVIARCSVDAIASIWHKFGIVLADARQNERMEKVRAGLLSYSDKQAANAGKRWKKSDRIASAMPPHRKPMPPHESGTDLAEPNGCSSSSSSSSLLPLSSPNGDSESENDTLHSRSAETAEKKEAAPRDHTAAPADEPPAPGSRAAIDATEAAICALFGRRQLGAGYKQLLGTIADSLPLPDDTWRHLRTLLLARKKAGPQPEDFTLRHGWLISADKLAEQLLSAAEIARQWFTDNPSADASTEKKSAPPAPCPDGWPEWFAEHYPQAPAIRFAAAPPEIRQEFRETQIPVL